MSACIEHIPQDRVCVSKQGTDCSREEPAGSADYRVSADLYWPLVESLNCYLIFFCLYISRVAVLFASLYLFFPLPCIISVMPSRAHSRRAEMINFILEAIERRSERNHDVTPQHRQEFVSCVGLEVTSHLFPVVSQQWPDHARPRTVLVTRPSHGFL